MKNSERLQKNLINGNIYFILLFVLSFNYHFFHKKLKKHFSEKLFNFFDCYKLIKKIFPFKYVSKVKRLLPSKPNAMPKEINLLKKKNRAIN